MGRPLLTPGASTGSAMRPGSNGGSGRQLGRWCLSNSCPWWRGSGVTAEPGPRSRSGPFQGRQLGPPCRLWSQAAMTVPRLVIKCSHDAAQRAALKTGRCWRGRQAPRDCQRGPLLTGCSQTVRIHLDVAAHVGGKYAGQVHTGGRICTWWDGLVGFKSPASRPQRSPMTWAWLGLRHSEIRECTGPRGVAVHWAAPSGRSARSCPARCGGDLGAYCGWAQYVGCSPKLSFRMIVL
jgi:hypothetical protein